jgi:hypothetical protein
MSVLIARAAARANRIHAEPQRLRRGIIPRRAYRAIFRTVEPTLRHQNERFRQKSGVQAHGISTWHIDCHLALGREDVEHIQK